jgi:aminoglycoside phosphotransferase (APT) family kinase protein
MMKNLFSTLRLGELQKEPEVVTGGCSHVTYRVETDQGIYAVKALNSGVLAFLGGIDLFKRRDDLLSVMINHGFPAVSAIHIDGQYAVYPWKEGEPLSLSAVAEPHVKTTSQLLSTIHQYSIVDIDLPFSPWQFLPETDWDEFFSDKNILIALKQYEKLYRQAWHDMKGQEVFSHGDLNYSNVLWQGEQACVLDWESMGLSYANAELISNAMGWNGYSINQFKPKQYQLMLRSYQEHAERDLHLIEADYYASWGYWLVWLVFCQKRVKGFLPCAAEQQAFYQRSVDKTLMLMQRLSQDATSLFIKQ